MVAPLLRVPASGYGGSGYKDLFGTGGTVVGVTTALGALDKGGIVQWSVDQTIGYMLANKDDIYNRTSDQAFGYLRWYHKRFKESDYDDPNVDIRNAHVGVLNDLADNGTAVHEWIEAYWTGGFEPDLYRPEQVQMVEAFLDWEAEHEIEVHATELTVFGDGYAGTADFYVTVDGVPLLVDGKGLPLDTPLPTPTGWTTMGDVQTGDYLLDQDGQPTRVSWKSPKHNIDCYRITFDNGETQVADGSHKWLVRTGPTSQMADEVLETRDLPGRVWGPRGQRDLRVPLPAPLNLPDADLPIDPYVLGVWLGDGTASKNEITINRDGKAGIVQELENRGWPVTVVEYPSDKSTRGLRVRLGDAGTFGVSGIAGQASEFKALLSQTGVLNNKHIPAAYLRASVAQRRDLLRGLMDTDGWKNAARNNEVGFSTTDESMRDQVAELLATLGERTYVYCHPVTWTHGGVTKETTAYSVRFRPQANPFLAREYPFKETTPGALNRRKLILSVEPVESVTTQCISVENDSETFLCGRGMTVTHNSSRTVRDSHVAQLAALGAADYAVERVFEYEEGARAYKDMWFRQRDIPAFNTYGVLQFRPDDDDKPRFCQLHVIPQEQIDVAFDLFMAAKNARLATKKLATLRKG